MCFFFLVRAADGNDKADVVVSIMLLLMRRLTMLLIIPVIYYCGHDLTVISDHCDVAGDWRWC